MFVIIVYDIPDDKRRLHLANTLLNYGDRVQKSVFECDLQSQGEFDIILQEIKMIIVEKEDLLRVYSLCQDCQSKITICGFGELSIDADLIIF